MTFTTILPLLSTLFVLYLGIFVWLKNRRGELNILFASFCGALIFWFFGTFMMFNSKSENLAIFWDRFVYAGVVFLPALMYHISLVFSQKKNNAKLILGYALSFLFLIISRTDYFVSDLFKYSWGYHTKARIFHHIFLIYFFVYLTFFYVNIYKYYKSAQTVLERLRAKYIFIAYLVLLTGAVAYLPAYGIDVFPIAYLSGLIFVIILAYTLLRHQLMDIKVALTEFLVGLIALILFIDMVISENLLTFFFRAILLLIFSFIGYLLIKSVLSEIKRREELEKLTAELTRTYEELKRLDKAKSEFLSIASHQLRTPLTAIQGYTSMLLEGSFGQLPEAIKQPINNILNSSQRLLKLINNLLNISRIEAGRIEIERQKISLENLISSIVQELSIEAQHKKIRLEWVKPPNPLPELFLDQEKIRQVILNIIDNAIRYTNRGEVKIEAVQKDSLIYLSIKDTGEGMTTEDLQHMFSSFRRGQAGSRFWTEGTGLGLYVAKKFIELHGGKIWAESSGKGMGSTFHIKIPISYEKNFNQRNN